MKKSIAISLLILLCGSGLLLAQTPLGMNYQGIARSADGSPIINQFIGLRISITSGPDGSVDFSEEHHPETNEFGLFAVVVGQGQTAGRITDVDWGIGNKWLQIEIDPFDVGAYTLVGSQQLMSVPYALYSAKSGDALKSGVGIDVTNGQVNNVLPDQIVNLTGTGGVNISGTYPNFTIDAASSTNDADADPENEIQSLSKTGNTVSLSNDGGGFIDEVNDADANATNELQTINKSGSTVTLSNGGGSYTDATNDADANPTNEIQTLSKTGNNLNLTSGGTVDLSSYNDNTDNQNLSSTVSGTNRTINVSGGTGTTISVADNDNSSSNELITNGSYVANNTVRITENGVNTNVAVGTLNANLNANSNRLTNVADPVSGGDAVNLTYLEAKDATDYAISVPISYTSSGGGDIALDLSGATLDKGSLITGSTITISEAGVYSISIQGYSLLSLGSNIEISINGSPSPVLKASNTYLGTYLIELAPGDQVRIITKFIGPETINLQISAYKI